MTPSARSKIYRQEAMMMKDFEDWITGNVGTLGVQRMLRCTDQCVVFWDDLCGRHDIWERNAGHNISRH